MRAISASFRDVLASPTRLPTFLLFISVLTVLVLTLLVTTHAPLPDDVAWLIYVAESWLDGHRPYRALIEVNPPTVVWISMLPVLAARALDRSVLVVAPFFFAAVVLACAWLTSGILRRQSVFENRAATFTVLATVLLLMPLSEFGQREHLIIAAALPFLSLHTGRPSLARCGRSASLLAGFLVGISCGMKPHYVLPFAMVEAAIWLYGRRPPWLALSAAGATLLALLAATLVLTPDYLGHVVPLALALYVPVPSAPLLSVSGLPAVIAFMGAVSLWWAHRQRQEDGGAMGVLLTFALGSWLVYLLQDKGWFYHRLPATVATTLAFLTWMATARASHTRPRSRMAVASVLLVCISAHAGIRGAMRVALATAPESRPEARMGEYLRDHHASSYVAFTYYLSWGFPLVQSAGVSWASRFPSTWALRAEHERSLRNPNSFFADAPVRHWVVQDFLAVCPEFVAVAENEAMDYLALLATDGPAFGDAWVHYRPLGRLDDFRIYARPKSTSGILPCVRGPLADKP